MIVCKECEVLANCEGNFIDTANNYQFQESEAWIGEWMQTRGVRDQMGEFSFPFIPCHE